MTYDTRMRRYFSSPASIRRWRETGSSTRRLQRRSDLYSHVSRIMQQDAAGHIDALFQGAFRAVSSDDASRLAFSQIMPDETKESAVAFLKAAVAYYSSLGIAVARVMTDNGSCDKALDFRDTGRDLGLKHIRTKRYTPKTKGKAERFIQTVLREWAYAQAYPTAQHRAAELPRCPHRDNWHRPHGSLEAKPPISRLGLSKDNLLRLHS